MSQQYFEKKLLLVLVCWPMCKPDKEYYRLFLNIFHRSIKLFYFIYRFFVFLKKISHIGKGYIFAAGCIFRFWDKALKHDNYIVDFRANFAYYISTKVGGVKWQIFMN